MRDAAEFQKMTRWSAATMCTPSAARSNRAKRFDLSIAITSACRFADFMLAFRQGLGHVPKLTKNDANGRCVKYFTFLSWKANCACFRRSSRRVERNSHELSRRNAVERAARPGRH